MKRKKKKKRKDELQRKLENPKKAKKSPNLREPAESAARRGRGKDASPGKATSTEKSEVMGQK